MDDLAFGICTGSWLGLMESTQWVLCSWWDCPMHDVEGKSSRRVESFSLARFTFQAVRTEDEETNSSNKPSSSDYRFHTSQERCCRILETLSVSTVVLWLTLTKQNGNVRQELLMAK